MFLCTASCDKTVQRNTQTNTRYDNLNKNSDDISLKQKQFVPTLQQNQKQQQLQLYPKV